MTIRSSIVAVLYVSQSALAVPQYRVVPLTAESIEYYRVFGFEGLDDLGNAYVNVIDDDLTTDYERRWNGTALSNYLPDPRYGVKSVGPSGHVVLQTFIGSQSTTQSAIWTPSQGLTQLNAPANLPGWSLYAQNANSSGVVAGAAWDGDNLKTPHVVVWDAQGVPTDLGVAPTGNSNPQISDTGILYGETARRLTNNFAGLTSVGFVGWGDAMQLITIPGYDAVSVTDLNVQGKAVVRGIRGASPADGEFGGFVWQNGQVTRLPDIVDVYPGFEGKNGGPAINDAGFIVGYQVGGALWEPDLTGHLIQNLLVPEDAEAWAVYSTYDINNSGVILAEVGRRTLSPNGLVYLEEPALLIPVIPEPATLLPALAAIPLCLRRRRR